MKKLITLSTGLLLGLAVSVQAADSVMGFEGSELLPPNARAGECYTRVFVPPVYKTVSERVLKKEASEIIEIIPAKYELTEEEVMVRGPSQRMELIPATHEWVEETVLIKESSSRLERIPAQFETVSEQVLDRPAHTVWKKGTGPIQKINESTGEIMCLVEIPATYKTIYKRMQIAPASTKEITIPAEYKTVRKQVMKTPPTYRTIDIPAEYQMVKVNKLVSPAMAKRISVPAEYQTFTQQMRVSEGKMAWERILCETNVSAEIIRTLQLSLKKEGYDPGKIDGVFGTQTLSAVKTFQREKGLPVGNLTYETFDKLGISVKSL